ncbi:MAG: hypothetical protein JXA25_16675 [Anaerolineales bacterium]|nr:hypothetical protein [Anaerolineales bacterium]
MDSTEKNGPSADLKKILDSAGRLGVELDEAEALQWLSSVSAASSDDQIVFDVHSGVFGHHVTMLDFSQDRLEYFRKLGKLVEFDDIPGMVETALALSGSAAQSKIQSYPGDADFFERINIIAPTREAALEILAEIIKQKAIGTSRGETFQLIEVKFGSYPFEFVLGEDTFPAGSPISWNVTEITEGKKAGFKPDGTQAFIHWKIAASDPGWCKLDWIVADPLDHSLSNASNMLDVTWQSPDGSIEPLDGYLDPYFQEVYLQPESIPIFSKIVKHVSSDALEDYVKQLEHEVNKYLTKDINYGKAAKRMYNIFRLTGRYEEALFIRELFDEPTTMLYQVWALIRTIDETLQYEHNISKEELLSQADSLILAVVDVLEGSEEIQIVKSLLQLKDFLTKDNKGPEWNSQVYAARSELKNLVNNFFYERLTALPYLKDYMAGFS